MTPIRVMYPVSGWLQLADQELEGFPRVSVGPTSINVECCIVVVGPRVEG